MRSNVPLHLADIVCGQLGCVLVSLLCLSVSIFLSVYMSLSLSVSLSFSVFLCLSLSVFLSVSLRLSLCLLFLFSMLSISSHPLTRIYIYKLLRHSRGQATTQDWIMAKKKIEMTWTARKDHFLRRGTA